MNFFKFLLLSFLCLVILFNAFSQSSGTSSNDKSAGKMLTGQLAATPPMGFNTWNTFQTKINEDMLKDMVDVFVSSGMRESGYQYFVLDDGWMAMERDQNGSLLADPVKFPHGMKAF